MSNNDVTAPPPTPEGAMTATSRDRAVPTPPSGPAGWFANRRVGTKILAALGVLGLVATLVGVLGTMQILQLRDRSDTLYSDNVKPLNTLGSVQRAFQAARARILEYGLSSEEARAKVLDELEGKDATVREGIEAYRGEGGDAAMIAAFVTPYEHMLEAGRTTLFPVAETGDAARYG